MNTTVLQKKYKNDGYAIVENFFTFEDVKELKNEVKRKFFDTKTMESRIPVNEEKLKKQGVFIGLSKISTLFKTVVKDEKLLNLISEITSTEVKFVDDKVVFKNASRDFGSPWHQDWQYWKGQHKFSVWIALDNATVENGCLIVLPGSHKEKIEHKDIGGDGFSKWISPDRIDEKDLKSLPITAGSFIILHDLIFHASHPNKNGEERWAFIPTYQNAFSLNHLFSKE